MPRNHVRAAFFVFLRLKHVDDLVQASDQAVDAAAFLRFDHRDSWSSVRISPVLITSELAKQNVAVAVGVSVSRMIDEHALAVVELPVVRLIGIGGPECRREQRFFPARRAHPVEYVDVRDDRSSAGQR